jgi:hypothetical protein
MKPLLLIGTVVTTAGLFKFYVVWANSANCGPYVDKIQFSTQNEDLKSIYIILLVIEVVYLSRHYVQ